MWKGSEMDPSSPEGGGSSGSAPPNQELIDLKDQYEQQQVLISQLKEMLRKNEQTATEKVEEYANTLNRMRAKAKQGRLKKELGVASKDDSKSTPGSRRTSTVNIKTTEKIMLLRQQLEENKVKLALRDKNKKDIEEMVIQLKAQLDDSQQIISQTPLNLSLSEPNIENLSPNSNPEELYNALLIKEKRVSDLTSKVNKLEANILDLQENLKEKDSVIDARTKAITLMTENLSKKGKHTLDELEDTKEQMRKMQENFVALETQLNTQKQNLLKQLKEKNCEIEQLQKNHGALVDENLVYKDKIRKHESRISELEELIKNSEPLLGDTFNSEKNVQIGMSELHDKLSELNTALLGKENELEASKKQVLDLQTMITEKQQENESIFLRLKDLEHSMEEKERENNKYMDKIKELEESVFTGKGQEMTDESKELEKLKKQLDEYNKNMIKVKAQHKAKLKDLNKKIEDFKKINDVNNELVKLHDENSKLKQQITDLEHKVKEVESKAAASDTSELYEKNNLIASLEEEIQIYKSEIMVLKEQLHNFSALENAQVTSEINSIHLEERIDGLEALNRKLEEEKANLAQENLTLLEKIEELKREKQEISTRLDHCLQENMELLEKLDKLSAEKVSSAESIEIVEGLTQQEKLELEAYQKSLGVISENTNKSEEHLEHNPELNESVNQLTEETSDLLRKIELFTEERREVMEKMEALTLENNQLHLKIGEIENHRDVLAETYEQLQNEKEDLDKKMQELQNENEKLKEEIENLQKQNQSLQEGIQLHKVKHGNMVEEMVNIETVTPLQESNAEDISKRLQMEIVEYKSLIEIQKEEIKDLKLKLLSSNTSDDLKQELAALEAQYEALLSENQKLKEAVKTNSKLAHEKDTIEKQLSNAKEQVSELAHEKDTIEKQLFDAREQISKVTQEKDTIEKQLTDAREHVFELTNAKGTIEKHLSDAKEQIFELIHEKGTVEKQLEDARKQLTELTYEKDTVEKQLSDAREQVSEVILERNMIEKELINSQEQANNLEVKLTNSLQQINEYKSEVSDLQIRIQDQEVELSQREDSIRDLNFTISKLNNTIVNLEERKEEEDVETMSQELQSLKETFERNIKQMEEYEEELGRNSEIIRSLEGELKKLNLKILETEHLLELKDDEIKKMRKENENKETLINNLQEEIRNKDKQFHKACEQLRERCIAMQNQIELNTGSINDIKKPLEEKIGELENKNKEQLEKMKKIAANLKKKTALCQELENTVTNLKQMLADKETQKEKLQVEMKEKDDKRLIDEKETQMLQNKVEELTLSNEEKIKEIEKLTVHNEEKVKELEVLSQELYKLKENINNQLQFENTQLKSQINQYVAINNDLQNIKTEYETQINALSAELEIMRSNMNNTLNTEIIRKDETITSLNEQLELNKHNYETSFNALQAKIQELELYIETQEAELTKYKEKANRLEEGLSIMEERRASLEKKAIELGAQLEEKSHSYEEISQTEDILEQRLSALIIHDEIIEKHLQEALKDNQELTERNRLLDEENIRLKEDLSSATGKIVDVSDFIEKISILENENEKLTETVNNLENECKRLQEDFNKKIFKKEQELDALEAELQSQIESNSNERKNLLIQSEHFQEQLKESNENQELLQEEISNYKNRLEKQHNDLQLCVKELEEVKMENKSNLIIIQQLQTQLQNNFENQQLIIEKLQSEIYKKDAQIANYQQQTTESKVKKTIEALNNEKVHLETKIVKLNNDVVSLQNELKSYKELRAQQVPGRVIEEAVSSGENLKDLLKEISTFENKENNKDEVFSAIQWNTVANDPFEFLAQARSQTDQIKIEEPKLKDESTTSDINDELQNKIKTLEFMLFNTEKERDDALAHCNQLTNELAQLIYKRESKEKHPQKQIVDAIESEIVPDQKMQISEEDEKQMEKIEFTPVYFSQTDGHHPVEEVIAPPKTAYLEYDTKENENKPKQVLNLEDEHQHTENTQPAISVNMEVYDENDDGWGWGPEEAKLEEEHIQNVSRASQESTLKIRISQLEEKIRVLELDRERHLEEIHQSQVKSGKLIKKLKELKNQNDKLTQKIKTDDFGDLEGAIQDELKSQINSLEKKIKELITELEKEKREKSNLLKRIDVLTASHEKMVEMKEKQDIEMLGWQQKNKELASKLAQFEWGDDGYESPKKKPIQQQHQMQIDDDIQALHSKIDELNETIKELTLDNEELQTLLEEQRNLRINAEKSKSLEPATENMKSEAEYISLLVERDKIKEKLAETEILVDKLNVELKNEIEIKVEMEKKVNNLLVEKDQLNEQNKQFVNLQFSQSEEKIKELEHENAKLASEIQSLNAFIAQIKSSAQRLEELQIKLEVLNKEKTELFSALQEKNVQIENLNDSISQINNQKSLLEEQLMSSKNNEKDLQKQLNEKSLDIENLTEKLETAEFNLQQLKEHENQLIEECKITRNELLQKTEECEKLQKDLLTNIEKCDKFSKELKELSEKLEKLQSECSKKSEELNSMSSNIKEKDAEYENKLSITVQQLAQEWAERVDQRGADVAESWKLHLEARETEFMQLEQQLRNEIFELESKFNALVNENNELRKNVDAEIRNEVDRISSLQQQINDDQLLIKKLTQQVEQQQHEIDRLNQQIKEKEDELQKVYMEVQEKVNIIKERENDVNEIRNSLTEQINEKQLICNKLQQELSNFKEAFNENLHYLDNCQRELATEKDMRYSLEKLNTDNKNYITVISDKLQEAIAKLDNTNKTISALENQIKNYEEQISILMKELEEKQQKLNEYVEENNNYNNLSEELNNKDAVINQMKSLLSEKEREFSYLLESKLNENKAAFAEQAQELQLLKQRLLQTENHYEELLLVKESDIQSLKANMQEQANKNDLFQKEIIFHENELKEQLRIREEECENLYKTVEAQKVKFNEHDKLYQSLEEQNKQLMEENKQISELQKIIEEQVLKIEELKQELFEKSKDYDSLVAEVDMYNTPRASETGPPPDASALQSQSQITLTPERKRQSDSELNDPVSRAELDLALYMLHQRDVRCEELTVELMQLLEERDTLQLKLSNALREKEELKSRILTESSGDGAGYGSEIEDAAIGGTTVSTTGAIPKSKASAIVLGATGTELATEATELMKKAKDDLLSNKLSELKSVGYRKDKRIVDEQEQRRLQELALMQQYQEMGALLPPEAAAKLVQDANYTLSRDVQSPSKVLLNWLWGRSTPKVNEI